MPRPFLLPCDGSGSETSPQQDLACSCADENVPIAVDAQAACEWVLMPSPTPNLSSRLHVVLGEASFCTARLYFPPRGEERSGNLLIPFWFRDVLHKQNVNFCYRVQYIHSWFRLSCIVSCNRLLHQHASKHELGALPDIIFLKEGENRLGMTSYLSLLHRLPLLLRFHSNTSCFYTQNG